MSETKTSPTNIRLPKTVIPVSYDLKIEPDLANAVFSGEETILLEIGQPVSEIVFNAAELEIQEAILCGCGKQAGTELHGSVVLDAENELAQVKFNGLAGVGQWNLKLKFSGILNNKLRGFYLSKYKNAQGVEELMATTKFEPADARRAFPCWDEPDFKSTFSITLVIDRSLNAVSNSQRVKEIDISGTQKKLVQFAPTIKMSTYLVAYIVGKLEASEETLSGGVSIRVWAVPGKKHLSRFALEAAAFSLSYFNKYFDIKYPQDKLDLVAIPDFASGAMENFGCITFRETALLLDEKMATQAEFERVAEVVAHEIAHMWFGDLVTMTWWNGLWLNEGFATFMALKCLHAWKPEWHTWQSFGVERANALLTDGLISTRPIEFPIYRPAEMRMMFDVLTYDKGASILRMLEMALGEERFRLGIAHYLRCHAFANADTPDLWQGIDEALFLVNDQPDFSVAEMMHNWVFVPGYPLISVGSSSTEGCVQISQQIFKYLPEASLKGEWQVPVFVRAGTRDGVVERMIMLSSKPQNVYVGQDIAWISANAHGNGFYRVVYSSVLEAGILANYDQLDISERFNFLSDYWACVQSGSKSVSDYMSLLNKLAAVEDDLNIWTVIVGSLRYLRRLFTDKPEVLAAFDPYVERIVGPMIDKLGWEAKADDKAQQKQLRAMLIQVLGEFGNKRIIQFAENSFAKYLQDKSAVESNLIPAIVRILAANGDAARYQQFVDLSKSSATPQEEDRYLYALAAFKSQDLAAKTLTMCLDGSVRTQNAPFLVRDLLLNPASSNLAWTFFKQEWDKLIAAYPVSVLPRMCSGIVALTDAADDVQAFFAERHVAGGEKAIPQYIEQIRIALALKQREQAQVLAAACAVKS